MLFEDVCKVMIVGRCTLVCACVRVQVRTYGGVCASVHRNVKRRQLVMHDMLRQTLHSVKVMKVSNCDMWSGEYGQVSIHEQTTNNHTLQ